MVHKVPKHGNIFLELHLDRADLEQKAKQICINLLKAWGNVKSGSIQVSEISGGITNILWRLQPEDRSLDPVVVRIFGKQTDKIIDRDHEKRVLGPLNDAGFGAKVLATFENGRIEEYLEMRPLKPEEMTYKEMAERIAVRLKQFHDVDMGASADSHLFVTISQWLDQSVELNFSEEEEKAKAFEDFDFPRMRNCLNTVKALAEKLAPRVSFSHNDLLSGNILIPTRDDKSSVKEPNVQLIDFEYSGFAYSSFDIANHFNEYAGFECDYSRFPDDDHIDNFMAHYLFGKPSNQAPDQEAIRKAMVEVKLLMLASHQFWGTWAILQAKYSPIDFDYIGYAKLRWDECYKREKEFLKQAEDFLGSRTALHQSYLS